MPHRAKNKHRARHRAHTFKAASLSIPALPLPEDQAQPVEQTEQQTEQEAADSAPKEAAAV